MNILAGDIGGTKTWLQISRCSDDGLSVLFEKCYVSGEYGDFNTLLSEFLDGAKAAGIDGPQKACIGVAGPVEKGCSKVTNLPWLLEEVQLQQHFGFSSIRLINDFQAIGFGIETLTDEEILTLQAGESQQHMHLPRVLIGAGTGLGQGILVWQGDNNSGYDDSNHNSTGHYEVLSSEGGHGDFAPGNQDQRELLNFLAARQTRVCVEDVLSGRGLANVYHFFADRHPEEIDENLAKAIEEGDAAAAISEAALGDDNGKGDSLASRALDLFVNIYGTQAGNLALTCMARGGVYITGGIAPRIRTRLLDGSFLGTFCDKGPMAALMKKIPVKLILNPQVGLKGAAIVASRL